MYILNSPKVFLLLRNFDAYLNGGLTLRAQYFIRILSTYFLLLFINSDHNLLSNSCDHVEKQKSNNDNSHRNPREGGGLGYNTEGTDQGQCVYNVHKGCQYKSVKMSANKGPEWGPYHHYRGRHGQVFENPVRNRAHHEMSPVGPEERVSRHQYNGSGRDRFLTDPEKQGEDTETANVKATP